MECYVKGKKLQESVSENTGPTIQWNELCSLKKKVSIFSILPYFIIFLIL